MKYKRIVNIVLASNPYPEKVFPEPTKEEYALMKKALSKYGLTPDKFFGSFGRRVWSNCIAAVESMMDDDV